MALDVEAFKAKPPPPEPRPPREVTPEDAKDVIEHLITNALVYREKVWLFHIGADKLGSLGNGTVLEKGLLQEVGLQVMREKFGLNTATYTERDDQLTFDLTKNKVRTYPGHQEIIPFANDLIFIRIVGHTAEGEESSVSWAASLRSIEGRY